MLTGRQQETLWLESAATTAATLRRQPTSCEFFGCQTTTIHAHAALRGVHAITQPAQCSCPPAPAT